MSNSQQLCNHHSQKPMGIQTARYFGALLGTSTVWNLSAEPFVGTLEPSETLPLLWIPFWNLHLELLLGTSEPLVSFWNQPPRSPTWNHEICWILYLEPSLGTFRLYLKLLLEPSLGTSWNLGTSIFFAEKFAQASARFIIVDEIPFVWKGITICCRCFWPSAKPRFGSKKDPDLVPDFGTGFGTSFEPPFLFEKEAEKWLPEMGPKLGVALWLPANNLCRRPSSFCKKEKLALVKTRPK